MSSETKKEKPTSIRFNKMEKRIIAEKANEVGKTPGKYVKYMALHGEEAMSMETMVQVQNLVNEAVNAIKDANPEKAAAMEREVNQLWTSLKY